MINDVVPLESAEAKELMRYMREQGLKFTHIKNETGKPQRGKYVKNWKAVWDKIDGVSPGFPDFLVVGYGRVVCIELKRQKGSTTSMAQRDWIKALDEAGVPSKVCKGAEEAKQFIFEQFGTIEATIQTDSVF